ncbi:MAG: hypothetical protein HY757_04225 [Nitrospirae bacterium]|nr:hypothetical protein [Nitrospirota bacterium]
MMLAITPFNSNRPASRDLGRYEYGCDWSIAKYIEAVETEDEGERKSLMDEILKYNEEDLKATWAVFGWLKKVILNEKVITGY